MMKNSTPRWRQNPKLTERWQHQPEATYADALDVYPQSCRHLATGPFTPAQTARRATLLKDMLTRSGRYPAIARGLGGNAAERSDFIGYAADTEAEHDCRAWACPEPTHAPELAALDQAFAAAAGA